MPHVESPRRQCYLSEKPHEILRIHVEAEEYNPVRTTGGESLPQLQPILPRFRTIELDQIRVRADGQAACDTARFVQDFVEVFWDLANWGCSIEHLVIDKCFDEVQSDVDLFREVVKGVVWDDEAGDSMSSDTEGG